VSDSRDAGDDYDRNRTCAFCGCFWVTTEGPKLETRMDSDLSRMDSETLRKWIETIVAKSRKEGE